MKKVLIISAYFPPASAADLHRVRQGLPYFEKYGWKPIILAVDPKYLEISMDPLLIKTIPENTIIHWVKAIHQKYTRFLGFGNLDLRSVFHVFFKGCKLIKNEKPDLVYFSTRAFYLMPLGRIWKKLYKIPYVVDIQDPWFEKNILHLPLIDRLPKHKLAYYVNKISERYVMNKADGMLSVSNGIVEELIDRYPRLASLPTKAIPFGAFSKDFEINANYNLPWAEHGDSIIITYIGTYGSHMKKHFELFYKAILAGLETDKKQFEKLKIYFIGTNYFVTSLSEKKLEVMANSMHLGQFVTELPARVPYFESLHIMKNSDILFLPGSKDKNYSSSKVYNYILSKKPILTLQHKFSDLNLFFDDIGFKHYIIAKENEEETIKEMKDRILTIINNGFQQEEIDWKAFEKYGAESQTIKQIEIFNKVLENESQ